MDLPQEKERWVLVRTHAQVQATKEQMEKKGRKPKEAMVLAGKKAAFIVATNIPFGPVDT